MTYLRYCRRDPTGRSAMAPARKQPDRNKKATMTTNDGDPSTRMKYRRSALAYLFASGVGGCAFSAVIFLGDAALFLAGAKNLSAFFGGAFDIHRLGNICRHVFGP